MAYNNSMSGKTFYLVLGGALMLIIGFLAISSPESENTAQPAGSTEATQADALFEIGPDDRFLNQPQQSKAILIEYSDFECPACAAVSPILQTVKNRFRDDLTVVFRHYPLTAIHPNALTAHRIAEAAHAQNAFAMVHDILFEQNQQWSSAANPSSVIYDILTAQTDLNIDQLREDANSNETFQTIQRQIQSGKSAEINSTPTLFLNGERIQLQSVEQLTAEIQRAIDSAGVEEGSNE